MVTFSEKSASGVITSRPPGRQFLSSSWSEPLQNALRHQCALSSAGADAADFVRLRLWADNGECVRQVMHAQVYRLLYAAVLPPEINAAVSKN
jgi:hypothetical protein